MTKRKLRCTYVNPKFKRDYSVGCEYLTGRRHLRSTSGSNTPHGVDEPESNASVDVVYGNQTHFFLNNRTLEVTPRNGVIIVATFEEIK